MTYEELLKARDIFMLSERVTLREIKNRHRELVKRHHPDAPCGGDADRMTVINAAYEILLAYVTDYRFSFAESEFYEQNPDEQLRRQFADPLWGSR